jgi:hypothetical protein
MFSIGGGFELDVMPRDHTARSSPTVEPPRALVPCAWGAKPCGQATGLGLGDGCRAGWAGNAVRLGR